MKNRLQFNRHFALYETREEAINAFNKRITDPAFIPLIGEPIVLRYKDENGNVQVILAIGKKGGRSLQDREYHLIDTAELDEKIAAEVAAREELDAETIKKIFFDGIESDFAENIARLSVSANVIPVGEDYESHVIPSNPEGKPHPIHADYTVTDAIKQADINFIDFTEKAGEKFQELDEKIDAETDRATAAENSISGQTSALSGAVIAFSAETVDELAELSGVAKSIQEELDATQVGAGLGNDGKYTPVENSNYISEASSLRDADAKLDVAVWSLSGVVNSFSANTATEIEGLKTSIAEEVERATESENAISGSVDTFSAKTVSEISRLDGKIDTETERATNIENRLSGLTERLSSATVSEIERIDSVITRNKVKSTGNTVVVSEAAEGTNLEVNIDRKTILSNNGVLKTGLKVAQVSDLEANVREAFRLVDNEGNPVDNTIIKIYKSSSLVNVELVNVGGIDYVRITYIDNIGATKTMDLNIQQLIFEAEFKDGLTVDAAGEVKVLIDPLSESYLSVSSNGVKLDGISNAITSAVENEKLRAMSAETAIRTDLNSEIANRTNADTVLNNAITAETASRISADNVLDGKITAERERAIGAENEIKNNFNSFTASTQSSLTSLNEAINTETTNRINGDTALDNKISAERERAVSAETALGTSIQTEALARENADSVLERKIETETTRATGAETTLASNINAEQARATGAENSLRTSITTAIDNLTAAYTQADDDITAAYTQADNNIVAAYTAAISQEATSRTDADNRLERMISDASSEISGVETRLNNEITRATTAENAITGNVQNLSGATMSVSGKVDDVATGLAALSAVTEQIISGGTGGDVTELSAATMNLSAATTSLSVASANYFDGAEYDSTTKHINFKHGSEVKTYIDASDFIKDGMVDSVSIVDSGSTKCLVITFNTDAGKEDIILPIGDIFDPSNYYTKNEINNGVSASTLALSAATIDVESGLETLSGVVINNELVTAEALVSLNNKITELSGNTSITALSAATTGLSAATVAISNNVSIVSGAVVSLSAATVSISGLVETNNNGLQELSATVMDDQFVIAQAFNDLNDRLEELSGATPNASNYYTTANTYNRTEVDENIADAISGQVVFVEGTVTSAQYGSYFTAAQGQISVEEAARLFVSGKTILLKQGTSCYQIISGWYEEGAPCGLYAYDGHNEKRIVWD